MKIIPFKTKTTSGDAAMNIVMIRIIKDKYIKHGDICPSCGKGRMIEYPKDFFWEKSEFRCNKCLNLIRQKKWTI